MTQQRIRVTKIFIFDMAHALYGHDGPCRNIHGHTYHLRITLLGPIVNEPLQPKDGMVMDFGDLKRIVTEKIIDVYDHALVLNGNSPHKGINGLEKSFEKVVFTNFQPTSENLVIDFLHRIRPHVPSSLMIQSIRLDETPASYAEWLAGDN